MKDKKEIGDVTHSCWELHKEKGWVVGVCSGTSACAFANSMY